MAARRGLSQSTVSRIWRAFELRPHRVATFKLSKDPLFIEKVRHRGPVPESTGQGPGLVRGRERADSGARSRATGAAYASGTDRAAGPRLHAARNHDAVRGVEHEERNDHQRVPSAPPGRGVPQVPESYRRGRPARLDVHLILDNSSTHEIPLIHRWLLWRPRVHSHFTPTGASWINLVKRWFAALTERQQRRGVHRSTRELEQTICAYIGLTNGHAKPFVRTTTADEILASVSRFCHRISDSGH